MDHLIKKFFLLFLSLTIALSFPACSRKNTENNVKKQEIVLRVAYDSGKYGDDWIKTAAAAFNKSNTGVTVKPEGDPQLDKKVTSMLASGSNLPDLVFLPATNWQYFMEKGYLTDLAGLYNTPSGDGRALADKVQPDVLSYCKSGGKYWIYPWGDGASGFVYNTKMFDKYGWQVPKTVGALKALIQQMKEKGIAPFSWGTDNIESWNEIVLNWWAQYEGSESMKQYLAMASPQVYKQSGRLLALKAFQDIACVNENSLGNPNETDSKKAVAQFLGGHAAMMPSGYLSAIRSQGKLPSGVELKVMAVPVIDGAKDVSAVKCLAGGFAFIPSKAQHKVQAQDFLAFFSRDDMLSAFTKATGSPAPFIYKAADTRGIDALQKSILQIWQDGKKIYMFSQNPVYYNGFLDWPYEGSPLLQIYEGDMTPEKAFQDNFSYAQQNWGKAFNSSR